MQVSKMTSVVRVSSQNSGTSTLLWEDVGSQNSVRIFKVALFWNNVNI